MHIKSSQYDSPLLLCEGVEEVVFDKNGYFSCFNRPIELPMGLKRIVFGEHFTQPVSLPSSLRVVAFGGKFNCHVTLPSGLREVALGSNFNHPVSLPPSVRKAKLYCRFSESLTLPPLLEELHAGFDFNHPIDLKAARKLRVLRLGHSFETRRWHASIQIHVYKYTCLPSCAF